MPSQAPAKPQLAAPTAQSSLAKDSLWSLLSESIAIPGLILSAAILSRTLKPEGMGQFSIAMTFVQWFQFAAIAGLLRIGTQIIAKQGTEWQSAASNVMTAFLVSGAVMTALGMALASTVSYLLNVPELTPYLMVICLNVFFFSGQQGLRTVLAATGRFKERSLITLILWTIRIVLTVGLVFAGWHLWGAVIAFVVSTAIALLAGFAFVRLPLRFDKSIFLKLGPAMPLLLSGTFFQIVEKVDVFLIKGTGCSIADTGLFSIAKNASGVAALLGLSVMPVVVAAVSRHIGAKRHDLALSVSRQALNLLLLILPFGAVIGTTGKELVELIYGDSFIPASVYLGPLFINALLLIILYVYLSLLTTYNYIRVNVIVGAAALLLNLLLQPFAITSFGMFGCACVEVAITMVALLCTASFGWNELRLTYSLRTVGTTALVFVITLIVGSVWVAPLPVPVLKTILVSLLVPALYFVLKEPGFLLCLEHAKGMLVAKRRRA